jgi:hypothetical protein
MSKSTDSSCSNTFKELGIDYFQRNHFLSSLQVEHSLRIRRQIYEWFKGKINGVSERTFIDHGSTPDTSRGDSNCFIKWLLDDGAEVLSTSIEDVSHLIAEFPNLKIIPWPPSKKSISNSICITSSAVVEHVGSRHSQIEYVYNLFSLGSKILLTTPNRFHWLEFHTKIPLLHWLPKKWHRAVLSLIGMRFWAKEDNLNLLSESDLKCIVQSAINRSSDSFTISWYKPRFMGATSNLVVLIEAQEDRIALTQKDNKDTIRDNL